jgi:hypothetical protein
MVPSANTDYVSHISMKGALSTAAELPSIPSSFTLDSSFFILHAVKERLFRLVCDSPSFGANLKCHPERAQIVRAANGLAESKDPDTVGIIYAASGHFHLYLNH